MYALTAYWNMYWRGQRMVLLVSHHALAPACACLHAVQAVRAHSQSSATPTRQANPVCSSALLLHSR